MYKEEYNGVIQFGDLLGFKWYGFDDYNHSQVQANIKEVISRPELFKGFELYITGGILEGWLTWDIDWAIVGPYQPQKIKKIFKWIIEIGFEHNIYPDVTYAKKLFDLHDWQNGGVCEDRWIYRQSDTFVKEGVRQDLSNYIKVEDDFYKYWCTCPFDKNIEMNSKGYRYKKPIRVI